MLPHDYHGISILLLTPKFYQLTVQNTCKQWNKESRLMLCSFQNEITSFSPGKMTSIYNTTTQRKTIRENFVTWLIVQAWGLSGCPTKWMRESLALFSNWKSLGGSEFTVFVVENYLGNFIYFYQRRKMPRRKKTKKNTTSRVRPMLPEGDLETSMTIDERRAKLDVYIEDFNMQGRFYLDFYFFLNLNIMTWVLIFRERTLKLGILEKPRINRSCFRSACLRSVLRDLSGTLGT